MNEHDPRTELAEVARGVRRYLQRHETAGLGELLVAGANAESSTVRARRDAPASHPPPAPGAATASPVSVAVTTGQASAAATRGPAAAPATTGPASAAVPTAPATAVTNKGPATAVTNKGPASAPAPAGSASAADPPDLSSSWEPVSAPAANPLPTSLSREPDVPAAPVRPARGAELDLFGRAIAPAPTFVEEPEMAKSPERVTLETVESLLNPIGAAREPVLSASLPVLEAIATEVRACTQCGLCETRTQAVPGVGSAASGIVFVGEAPGAEEDRRGEPFVGRAGELLTRIIQAMDEARLIPGVKLDRQTVYICNVLKCRPPENRNPLPHEIQMCSPYLERQLEALKPRIICCLGKFAAELLAGVKGTIGGLRGKTYRYRGAKLIVTYHPAACLRNPAYKRPVWEDMQLLAREYLAD